MELRVKSFDAVLSPARVGDLPRGLRFTKLGAFQTALRPDTLLGREGLDGQAARAYLETAEATNGQPIGVLELSNVHVVWPQGLIVDARRKVCWVGRLINWSPASTRKFARVQLGRELSQGQLLLDDALLARATQGADGTLWAAPGFRIFGHWLLDFLPRLHCIREHGLPQPILCPPIVEWGRTLLGQVFPDHAVDPTQPDELRVTVHERLTVPTMIRLQGMVEASLALPCWTEMATRLREAATGTTRAHERIFVSRAKWRRGSRNLHNVQDVERRFERAGFAIVHPETLGFSEQYALFSNASGVAGVDGSGLHNTIYSPTGTRIAVLCWGRLNPIHLSCANALGHHITYVPTDPASKRGTKGWQAPEARVDGAIERLLAR